MEECQFKLSRKHGNINIMRYKILVKTQSSRISFIALLVIFTIFSLKLKDVSYDRCFKDIEAFFFFFFSFLALLFDGLVKPSLPIFHHFLPRQRVTRIRFVSLDKLANISLMTCLLLFETHVTHDMPCTSEKSLLAELSEHVNYINVFMM